MPGRGSCKDFRAIELRAQLVLAIRCSNLHPYLNVPLVSYMIFQTIKYSRTPKSIKFARERLILAG